MVLARVSRYPPPATPSWGKLRLQKREDLHVNYARHETNVPEVTLLIVIKHLTGRKRLALRTFGEGG